MDEHDIADLVADCLVILGIGLTLLSWLVMAGLLVAKWVT